jgi:hypothetical protein
MSRKTLFVCKIGIALFWILAFSIAGGQVPRRITASSPADRPPFRRDSIDACAMSEIPQEGLHILQGPRRLILQNLDVAILMADDAGAEDEVVAFLLTSGYVANVDVIQVQNQTPVLADIEDYDAVLTWSAVPYHNRFALGDLLADYIDLGKGVIALQAAYWYGSIIDGRFLSDYSPLDPGGNIEDVLLGDFDTGHPLMTDVYWVTEHFAVDVSVTDIGTCVAWWDNDSPFVAYNHVNNRVVGINGYIGAFYRQWTGDMLQVVLNSLLYVTGDLPESCRLSKCGEPYTALDASPGRRIVTFFDPADCPGNFGYPVEVKSAEFQLYALYGWYPADVDIVVFDMADPDDFCQGPGSELFRFTYTCDQSFEFPDVGTALFPEPLCVEGPFFIGIEYTDPVIAVATYDVGPPVVCDVWYYAFPDWYEWYSAWDGEMGYPIFWVNLEENSPDCPESVPTLSQWGMLVMVLLTLAAGTAAIVRKRRQALDQNS